jgi:hypothetical protein
LEAAKKRIRWLKKIQETPIFQKSSIKYKLKRVSAILIDITLAKNISKAGL